MPKGLLPEEKELQERESMKAGFLTDLKTGSFYDRKCQTTFPE
jgi:hypothetical protein